ncbi:circadian clock protein KaiA [Oscillatoria sp. CS-180]|uniref:circadian clock protein KaiA n=1 Tax=Oscillatoria sp. CS-180 TaxID=3021720 RepID=UPI0023314745|nr:circadian clock protein KaiA [Oscillatoria sp. CS-180]MDB9528656.1 circadian clock protein KaiA [Oscillatoria sp. CS-180]
MHSQFLIGGFAESRELSQVLTAELDTQTHHVHLGEAQDSFLHWIEQNRHRVDCLVIELSLPLSALLTTLRSQDILLPMLVIDLSDASAQGETQASDRFSPNATHELLAQYHQETICIDRSDLSQLEHHIHRAISQFLNLPFNQLSSEENIPSLEDTRRFLLSLQQQRLSEKLQERLGYLGVYYKRNPDNFLRHLTPAERSEVLEKLRLDYRNIILSYFAKDEALNQKIDNFVNTVFFADISVSKLVEVHMELMDNFSKQLKLEGRSEEILLDYRLTLIDVIAHLCEMYRRSIPREA